MCWDTNSTTDYRPHSIIVTNRDVGELFESGILNAEQISQSADEGNSQSTQSEVDKIGDQLGF
jgi:hypothetical protein